MTADRGLQPEVQAETHVRWTALVVAWDLEGKSDISYQVVELLGTSYHLWKNKVISMKKRILYTIWH